MTSLRELSKQISTLLFLLCIQLIELFHDQFLDILLSRILLIPHPFDILFLMPLYLRLGRCLFMMKVGLLVSVDQIHQKLFLMEVELVFTHDVFNYS